MEEADLLINIDGYNEMMVRDERAPIAYPLYFPELYRQPPGGSATVFRAILGLLDGETWTAMNVPLLGRSPTYFLFWSMTRELAESARDHLSDRLASELKAEGLPVPRDPRTASEVASAIWKKYTFLEHSTASAFQKPVVFFIQFNQWVEPRKPFSPKEAEIALASKDKSDPVDGTNARYQFLLARAEELRKAGLLIGDLRAVFEHEERQVYVDDCCHVNDLGNELIAKAIVAFLKTNHTRVFHPRGPSIQGTRSY
jgi:hypothetical protein